MKQIGAGNNFTYKVYDNFLEESDFRMLQNNILNSECAWYFSTKVGTPKEIKDLNNFYFIHNLYLDHEPKSRLLQTIQPLIKKLNVRALMRAKLNLFTRTEKIHEFDLHQDLKFDATSAVFSLNTCDGGTILENDKDRIKVDSVENTLLLFNSTTNHRSTTCTDSKFRMNINLMYF